MLRLVSSIRRSELVAGVDYGKRRIAVSVSDIGVKVRRVSQSTPATAALFLCSKTLAEVLNDHEIGLVVIESPILGFSKNAQTLASMGMMAGALSLTAGLARVPVIHAPPSTWKKQVVGKGNASKEEIAAWLKEQHPDLYKKCIIAGRLDVDAVDATCMSLYGVAHDEEE